MCALMELPKLLKIDVLIVGQEGNGVELNV